MVFDTNHCKFWQFQIVLKSCLMHALQDSNFLLWTKENLSSLMHKEKILMTVWKFQNLQGFVLWKAIQEWLNIKSCFPIQILCNCHFCGIWLKIRLSNFKMLFQFLLTKLLKSELLRVYRKLIRWLSIKPRSVNYNSSTHWQLVHVAPFIKLTLTQRWMIVAWICDVWFPCCKLC